MKNRKIFLLYLFVLCIVVLLAYNRYTSKQNISVSKTILPLPKQTVTIYKKQFDTNRSFGYIWGIANEKKKTEMVATKDEHKHKKHELHITQDKSSICIEKSCYRLLGIYHKGKVAYISFYSKTFKKGIKDFTLHEKLDKSLYIKSVKDTTLVIADKNSSKEWRFKLFDVNATKYRPKDTNETDF